MNPVIKSGVADSSDKVRPLPLEGRARPIAVVDADRLRLQAELDSVVEQLRQRDAEIERLKVKITEEARAAEAKGYEAGLKAAADREAERVETLATAVRSATDAFAGDLASLQRLAPLLAAEGLERIVGDARVAAQLLEAAVLHAVDQLDADAIVRVDVAAADFADLSPLREAIAARAHRSVEVRYAANLEPGDCRIRLVLGELEVGLNQQWGRLSALLSEMASPEAAP